MTDKTRDELRNDLMDMIQEYGWFGELVGAGCCYEDDRHDSWVKLTAFLEENF